MAYPSQVSGRSYVSASTLAKVVLALLAFHAVLSLFGAIFGMSEAALIRRAIGGVAPTPSEIEANDARTGLIAITQLGIYIVCVVTFCFWIYRANRAARSMGADGMEFSPGWSVGWWFVPFANLIKPFQATNEIWRASDPDHRDARSWQVVDTPPLLRFWWAAWLISGFLGQVAFRMSLRIMREPVPALQDLLNASNVGVASDFASLTAAALAFFLVMGINQRQDRKRILMQSSPVQAASSFGGAAGRQWAPQAAAPQPSADSATHYARGVQFHNSRDFANAIAEYQEAVRQNPNFAEAHYSLGLAYLAIGERSAANAQVSRLESINLDWAGKLRQLMQG